MSKANETQVGGSHYARGGKLQHWDYAVRALGNRYLEGAITKYVMRHRHKGVGEQDLNKALHFTEKLLEEFHAGRVRPIRESRDFTFSIHEMSVVNGLNTNEDFIVKRLASWENDVQLSTVIDRIKLLLADERQRQRASDAAKAGAGMREAAMDRVGEVGESQ